MTNSTLSFAARLLGIGLCATSSTGCGMILGIDSDATLSAAENPQTGPVQCKGTIRVRVTTDETGISKDTSPPYNHGVLDYVRELNETQGGIRGCLIDIDVKDAHYTVAGTQDAIKTWSSVPEWAEVSAVFVYGTGPAKAVAASLATDPNPKIVIPGSYAGSLSTPVPIKKDIAYSTFNAAGTEQTMQTYSINNVGYPYIFFPGTDYSTGIRAAISYIWNQGGGRIAMVADESLQMDGTNTCAFCIDPLPAGKEYIPTLGGAVLLGPDLGTIPQTSDQTQAQFIEDEVKAYVAADIEKVKADPKYIPVTWFWVGNSVVSASLVGKAMAAAQELVDTAILPMGVKPWKLSVIVNNFGIGETTATICGAECNTGNFYGLFAVPRYGDVAAAAGMQKLMDTHDKWRAKDNQPITTYQDVRYVQGYAAAVMWRKGIEAALDAGHASPTGTDLKNALETFNLVDLDGMTAQPISFTPEDHRPQSQEYIYHLNANGVLVLADKPPPLALQPKWLGY